MQAISKFKGTGVALITPFDKYQEIDYIAFRRILEHNANNGVDYFVVNGTTGESATTNRDEKRALLDFILANNPKKLPIMFGTGGYDTRDIISRIQNINWDGVSALLSVSPYYNKPSQKGIIAHYKAVADACPVPVVLYNVPKRTGQNMAAETTLELAEHPNIIGIKEASGDFNQIIEIMTYKSDDFLMISGDDMITVPMISLGCTGVISVLANAFPAEMSNMVRLAMEGKFKEACKYLFKLDKINPLMYEESSPVGIKETLALMGICENYVRLPLVPGSESLRKKIREYLRQ